MGITLRPSLIETGICLPIWLKGNYFLLSFETITRRLSVVYAKGCPCCLRSTKNRGDFYQHQKVDFAIQPTAGGSVFISSLSGFASSKCSHGALVAQSNLAPAVSRIPNQHFWLGCRPPWLTKSWTDELVPSGKSGKDHHHHFQ